MVVDEQDKCARFEYGLRSKLMMQVAPLQQRVFEALVDKTKIFEEVRCKECETKEQERVLTKRESGRNVQAPCLVKQARDDQPLQNIVVVGGRV